MRFNPKERTKLNISLDPDIVRDLNEYAEECGFRTRSQAVEELLSDALYTRDDDQVDDDDDEDDDDDQDDDDSDD